MRFSLYICLVSLIGLALSCHAHPLDSLKKNLGVNNFKSFQRKPSQERWDLQDRPEWNHNAAMKDLNKLGFINTILPSKKKYSSAVILGGSGPSMQSRVHFLIKLWESGTRFEQLVFLTGDRELGEIDQPSQPGKTKNETELLKLIWKRTVKPEKLSQLKALWVDAPKIVNSNGSLSRPTTISTIQAWEQIEPLEHKDILAVSNQPLVYYQECALINYLPQSAKIDTVGPAANPDLKLSIYLNTLSDCFKYCPTQSRFISSL